MSKVLPDPQIQSLRAMRAGDIAIALPTIVTMPETAVAVPSDVVLSGTPSETAGVGSAFANTLSQDPAASESFLTANSLEALSGTPNESPVVGVGTATSVV